MKKTTSILCIVFVVVMLLSLPISAATSYYTYTYSISGTALHSPHAYTPEAEIDTEYMGLKDTEKLSQFYPNKTEEELENIAKAKLGLVDLEVDENNNVYVVDKANGRVIILDPYYAVKNVIHTFDNANGNSDTFNSPEGIFVSASKTVNGVGVPGKIYVCDTGNARILVFDLDGKFIKEIGKPKSEILDASSDYMPIAVAVDRYDRLYVVNSNSTGGIEVITEEGEFTGYIGAQKSSLSLWDKIWRRFQTEEQKISNSKEIAPPFNNIALAGDFVYATITLSNTDDVANAIRNKSKSGDFAPVRMLNAAGSELMRRNGFYPPSGEVDFFNAINSDDATYVGPSRIVDVAVGPENTWSIIDQERSKVFTYDFDGNLLFAFGDKGALLGNIEKAEAIVYQGTDMLLLDGHSDAGSFTVYERTPYGNVLMGAIENQNNRRYDDAINDWQEVIKRNSNFDAAYIGMGNAYYRSHEYTKAIDQYKNAYDVANYSTTYTELRQQWISKYLWTIPIIVFVLCFALSKFMKYANKVNKETATAVGKRTYVQELLFVFHLIMHPFDGFWDLKHEKRGSVRAGSTILAVAVLVFYYQSVGAGYVSNPQGNYLSFFEALTSLCVPLALFMIANWCLTTLFDGEGNFKDIYIACTYSLMPLILTIVPATLASNFVVQAELKTVSLITALGFIWLGILLFFGMMITHDYSIGKNVVITISTIVGMICIMFIAILFTTLLGKLVSFVTNIATELRYRM